MNPGAKNRNNRIEDNWVHHVGREYRGGIGISLEGATESTVRHNQVEDLRYSGIVIIGPESGPVDTRIRVEANSVVRSMRALTDGGGIYAHGPLGTTFGGGAVIRGNVVHDTGRAVRPEGVGVYTDVRADMITVERNVLYRNPVNYGGVEPRRLRFIGNFWDGDQPFWWPEDRPTDGVTVTGNTLLPWDRPKQACAATPACAAIVADAGRPVTTRTGRRPE